MIKGDKCNQLAALPGNQMRDDTARQGKQSRYIISRQPSLYTDCDIE